jgi:hypothetical protein
MEEPMRRRELKKNRRSKEKRKLQNEWKNHEREEQNPKGMEEPKRRAENKTSSNCPFSLSKYAERSQCDATCF